MKTKNRCTIDSRVKDQYVYQPEKERWVSTGFAQVMCELHEFRVKMGHEPGGAYRPIHDYEEAIKGRRKADKEQ